MGWGGALDKIMGQFSQRDERLRNDIDKTKRHMDKLAQMGIDNPARRKQYDKLSDKLRVLEQKGQNR